ncbi:conserved hypothetical protein [Mucor ambiguus]|uniref:SWIRM-domain-containing protein n=1 Tax=Mucor ambiguus TaxID=91626 RepID=A0A0C9LWH3_9FUNG|nr:conserved hypothetical protein [Mucor ambiguus]
MSAPKRPRIDIDYYEQPKTIGYFESIINALHVDLDKENADTSFSAPDLSYFTAHFQKFQLDHLGKDAMEKAKRQRKTIPTGVPFSLFNVHQLDPESPLYFILKAAYKYKSDNAIVDWRFDAKDEIPTYLTMVQAIKKALLDAEFDISIPCVLFDAAVDEQKKQKLSLLVEGLGGKHDIDLSQYERLIKHKSGTLAKRNYEATFIVYSEEAALDKHHKHWRIISKDQADENEDEQALVHWIGLPDSYNSRLALSACAQDKQQETDLPQEKQKAPWNVASNWIEDSAKYNEWMSPLDYVIEERQKTQLPKRKRPTEEELEEEEAKKKQKTPPPTQEDIARQFMPVQQHEIIIPSYAAWFDIAAIHPIESRGLPEFFNNKNASKTPTIYKEYRDFMVNTYRLNPLEYLTVTACRRNMTGDVCAIIRVHAFLEQWGLINYQMDPTAKPTAIGPPFEGQIKIVAELPPGLKKSIKKEAEDVEMPTVTTYHTLENETDTNTVEPPNSPPSTTTAATCTAKDNFEKTNHTLDLNLDLRVDIYEAAAKAYREKKSTETCASCRSASRDGYHHDTTFVCSPCFEADKIPADTKKEDFAKKQLPQEEDVWTEQEDMFLLEGLEMYPNDWSKVAEHVSTKSREACILHYLKLPTADPRIDPQVKRLGLLDFNRKDHVENPIMSVVAFLASNVKPKVAASAIRDVDNDADQDMELTDDQAQVDSLQATYTLIQTKIAQFSSRMSGFEKMETLVDRERRHLEKERFLIRQEHLAIRNQMDSIYGRMFQEKQAKLLKEQQHKMALELQQQQAKEELMPAHVVVRLPHEMLSPEELEVQNQLRAKYPVQYLQRQHALSTQLQQQQQQQQQNANHHVQTQQL